MSTGAIAAYRKNGRFADGSVLVKEVFEATTGAMTTGTVISHAQPLTWLSAARRSGCEARVTLDEKVSPDA
jgi:hypothetical protein